MTQTISVEVYKSYAKREFAVGEFHPIEVPPTMRSKQSDTARSDRYEFVTWINFLAKQGLVFHSHTEGMYLFRAELPQ